MIKDYSREYGTALYRLAVEESTQKEVFEELGEVSKVCLETPEFLRLSSNPRLSASERAGLISNVFEGKVDKNLLSFMMILAEKRRLSILPKCFDIYKKLYCEDNGILPVNVSSAVSLSDVQRKRLADKLKEKTGKEVMMSFKIDPSCIGGLRVEYGGKTYDSGIKTKLAEMLKEINE